jgi:uroporphyrinogen-III synthase
MYLIIGNKKTCNYFYQELTALNMSIVTMPCVQLIPEEGIINQFKERINDFDIVIITSPTAIDYAGEVIKYADKSVIFIVSGFSSYTRLRQYTENKIYAPENDSGAAAIINQILDFMDLREKKIAILQGRKANNQTQDYLTGKYGKNSYDNIVIYQQEWLDLDTQFLKKLFISNSLQGIILTSSSHAEYLFGRAKRFGYYEMLLMADFITLHTKIELVLRKFGVKGHIFVSDTANNESLIDLMGKLHDRHNRYSKG